VPEDPKPTTGEPVEPAPAEATEAEEIGDFIARHVLEKDSTFLDG